MHNNIHKGYEKQYARKGSTLRFVICMPHNLLLFPWAPLHRVQEEVTRAVAEADASNEEQLTDLLVCLGQVRLFAGLARTVFMRCTYGILGREITKCTVILVCGVYVRFLPTLTNCPNFSVVWVTEAIRVRTIV
jgi:hypothetical protein